LNEIIDEDLSLTVFELNEKVTSVFFLLEWLLFLKCDPSQANLTFFHACLVLKGLKKAKSGPEIDFAKSYCVDNNHQLSTVFTLYMPLLSNLFERM
jgi:hypothetical protein